MKKDWVRTKISSTFYQSWFFKGTQSTLNCSGLYTSLFTLKRVHLNLKLKKGVCDMQISYAMVANVYVRQLTVSLVSRDPRLREGVFAL